MFRFPSFNQLIFFLEIMKSQRSKYFNLEAYNLVLLTRVIIIILVNKTRLYTNYWYDVISLSLININATFFKAV